MNFTKEETDTSSLLSYFVSSALKMSKVTRHNSTFTPAVSLRQTTRGRAGLEQLRKLLLSVQNVSEQLICQHWFEPLISRPAPVFGKLGLPPTTLQPQEPRRGPSDPHSPKMINRASARRKGSCDEREKERSVYPCRLCAFNHHPSCLPWPCPHNRVLTGAVSRQH